MKYMQSQRGGLEVFLAIVAVVLLAVGGYVLWVKNHPAQAPAQTTQTQTQSAPREVTADTDGAQAATELDAAQNVDVSSDQPTASDLGL